MFLKNLNHSYSGNLKTSMENHEFNKYSKILKVPTIIFKNDMEQKVKEHMIKKEQDMLQRRMVLQAKEKKKEKKIEKDNRIKDKEIKQKRQEKEDKLKAIMMKKKALINER